jgi:predicted PurR-regulated permease PerM
VLLGVPLPFILAATAALFNFVPYIGAIGGAVPAVLVAFSQGPQQALLVVALFTVVQVLEGNLLSPMIQKRAVDLPPAATILAQTALGALFGLPGILLATPVAAALLAALREVTADAPDDASPGRSAATER